MSWKNTSIDILSKLLRPGVSADVAAAFLSTPLKLAAPRKEVALHNLTLALPDATPEEKKEILHQTYEHLVWTGIEFIVLQRDPRQALDWVEAENSELLEDLDGKGAILLTGHIGNWELTAAWVAQSGRSGHKLTAIVRESEDDSERSLIENMRSHVGVMSLSKRAPMTRALAILKRGEFLGILPDQHGGLDGIMAPFFGVETSTSPGAAVFAHLTKKPLIPVYSHRIAPFRHKIRVGNPIEWTPQASRDETILNITTKINAVVEQMVREAPGQWLAQHRRFREIQR